MQLTSRGALTRSLAAGALAVLYGLGGLGISSFVNTPKAEARGGRGRGRGARGGRRGWRGGRGRRGRRGRGGIRFWFGPAFIGPTYSNCWWSPRRGRRVCTYW